MKNYLDSFMNAQSHSLFRWALFRFFFFHLLAYDLWTVTLKHAPRYGAGDFNASHFSFLNWLPLPQTEIVGTVWILSGFFALCAAWNLQTRLSIILTTIGYGGVYFWSQLDSYQHHYLLVLTLIILSTLPQKFWDQTKSKNQIPLSHWGVPLLYFQVSLMYFWTGFAKINSIWLNGTSLSELARGSSIYPSLIQWDQSFQFADGGLFSILSWSVMLGEFLAAIIFLIPRLWKFGFFLIPFFHIGVEILSLDIEWFSYYMIGLDLILLAPKQYIQRLSSLWDSSLKKLNFFKKINIKSKVSQVFILLTISLSCLLAVKIEAQLFLVSILLISILMIYYLNSSHSKSLLILSLIVIQIPLSLHFSDSLYDYYRLWGGDLKRRGFLRESIEKYKAANDLKKNEPARRFQQGQIHETLSERQEALNLYKESLELYENEFDKSYDLIQKRKADFITVEKLGQIALGIHKRCEAIHSLKNKMNIKNNQLYSCSTSRLNQSYQYLKYYPNNRTSQKIKKLLN